MSKFYSLFSSSKGNASFLGGPGGGILIDAGVSCRRLTQSLQSHGIPDAAVQAIFVTHSHRDHIAGLRVFLGKYKIPVYAMAETLADLRKTVCLPQDADLHEIDLHVPVCAAEITAEVFPTMHDAPGSCGFRFSMPDGQTCAVCTDLGVVTPQVQQGTAGADLVLLEANYDPDLLCHGTYPYPLQERIRGEYGHLSNFDSANFAESLIPQGTTRLILGHLSEQNNTKALAQQTVLQHLSQCGMQRGRDFFLEVSTQTGLEQAVIF